MFFSQEIGSLNLIYGLNDYKCFHPLSATYSNEALTSTFENTISMFYSLKSSLNKQCSTQLYAQLH